MSGIRRAGGPTGDGGTHRPSSAQTRRSRANFSRPALFFLAGCAAVLAGAFQYYRAEVEDIRKSKLREIEAIGETKAEQIAQWCQERRADVYRTARSPFFRRAVADLLADRNATEASVLLRERIELDREAYGYTHAFLLRPDRTPISLPGETAPILLPETHAALDEADRQRRAALSGLSQDANGTVWLDVVCTVLDEDGYTMAFCVFRSDAEAFLFPLIQSWPVPSETSEAFLITEDNGEVLFLNRLRHVPGPPMSQRRPLADTTLPAAMAINGATGPVEGLDYRGVPVLADLRPVDGTPWFLVAKVDAAEFLSEARYRAGVALGGVVILLVALAIMAAYLYRRSQAALYLDLYRAAEARREAEEEFRIALYSIGDAVITTGDNGAIKQMNPVAEALTGWTEDDAKGKSLDEVLRLQDEATGEFLPSPAAAILQHGQVTALRPGTLLISREGVARPIADSGAPIVDQHGRIQGVVLVFRDQTAEREAERDMLRVNSMLESTLESLSEAVIVVDPAARTVVRCNAAVKDVFGYEPEELNGRSTEILHVDRNAFERFGALSTEPLLEGRRFQAEYVMRRKDGCLIDTENTVTPIYKSEGYTSGVVSVVRDITERKQAERALREMNARLGHMLHASPTLTYTMMWNGSGFEAASVSENLLRITGFTVDEALDPHWWRRQVHPEDLEQAQKAFGGILDSDTVDHQYRFLHKSGDVIWIHDQLRLLRDDNGAPVEVVGAWTDISDLKRAEAERESLEAQLLQSQKMEAIGRLAGGVAHDFNNMLAAILGYTDLALANLPEGHPVRNDLEEVRAAASRSAGLTRQLLAFARKQTVTPRILDMNQTLEGMLNLLRRLIGEDVILSWKPGKEIWPVKMDPAQIDQIVANLVVNARDAMETTGVITIESRNTSLDAAYCEHHAGFIPGDFVLLSVSDTGRGMDQQTLSHIFEPFFTTKPQGTGTGLGLATVYGIVKQNGGFINVYSEPSRGTTVKIYLPRCQGEGAPRELPALPGPAAGTETILLVEDEESLLKLGVRLLERLGYHVLAASTPREALRIEEDFHGTIHLLLSDVVMPEMSGQELRKELAARRPDMKSLFMSGYTADIIGHQGILDNDVNFLAKPYTIAEIANKVREVLAANG